MLLPKSLFGYEYQLNITCHTVKFHNRLFAFSRHALWDKSKKNQFFQHVLEKNATPSRINFCYTINPQFYPKFINSAQKECLKNQDQIKRTMKRPELFENFVF